MEVAITNTGMAPLRYRVTKEEMEQYRIEEGMSWDQIGKLYHVTGNAAYKLGREWGVRGLKREERVQIYCQRIYEIDDGTAPAWMIADEVGCGENLVRRVRKERGMDNCVRRVALPDPCPRCEFPPSKENPMIGWACLWCWCDLLSDPRYVPRGQRVNYRKVFCETGWARELGLLPEPRRGKWRVSN